MKDFFISYNAADRHWAEWIAWALEEAGYTTLLQAWDFRPGGNFILQMHDAARQAARTIAVLSRNYLSGPYSKAEWAAALSDDPTGEKGKLVPVRVDADCSPEGLLGPITYVDICKSSQDESATREALLAGVRAGRAKPARVPVFPGAAERSVPVKPQFPALQALAEVDQAAFEKLQRRSGGSGWNEMLAELHLLMPLELTRKRQEVMNEIVAIDNRQAAAAVERDTIFKKLGKHAKTDSRYVLLAEESKDLDRERKHLWDKLKELDGEIDARRQKAKLIQQNKKDNRFDDALKRTWKKE